jgi:hypothetical protein
MGVDYSAVFGIGVEVDNSYFDQFYDEDDDFVDKYGILDELLSDTDYSYGQSGDGGYTGRENNWYIYINEEDSQLWHDELTDLVKFLEDNDVPFVDEGVVGGLHMW